MYRHFILLSLLFCLLNPCRAQFRAEGNIQISINQVDKLYRILPAQGKGILIYRDLIMESQSITRNWEFRFFDPELKLVWSTIIETEYYFDAVDHDYYMDNLYILFQGVKNLKKVTFVLRMNADTRRFEIFNVNTFLPSVIHEFEIFGNSMVFAGIEKLKPSVVLYAFGDNRPVILQGVFENKNELHDIEIDNENEILTVISGGRSAQGLQNIILRSYDEQGHPVEYIIFSPSGDKHLISARATIIGNTSRIVSGLYREVKSLFPDGIFISKTGMDGQQEVDYYSFSSLLTSPGEETDTTEAMQLQRKSRLYWNLAGFESNGDGTALVLEAFEKQKESTSPPISNAEEKLVFKESLVILLNGDGYIEWINRMDLRGIVASELKRNLYLQLVKNNMWSFFYNLNHLFIQQSEGQNIIAPRYSVSLSELSGENEEDQNFYYTETGLLRWTGHDFIFFGVRHKNDSGSVVDKTFFLEKICFTR